LLLLKLNISSFGASKMPFLSDDDELELDEQELICEEGKR